MRKRNLFEIDNYGEESRTPFAEEAGIANSFWNTDETGAKRDYVVARLLAGTAMASGGRAIPVSDGEISTGS